MKVSEAIYCMKAGSERYSEVCEECNLYGKTGCDHCQEDALEVAIKSLEMQDKLKQWIANYKNPEFKDVMITRDNLIDILNEFRLECETDARNTV